MSQSPDFPRPAQEGDEQILFAICTEALAAAQPLLAAYAQLEVLTTTVVAELHTSLPKGSGSTTINHGVLQHSSFDTIDRFVQDTDVPDYYILEQWQPATDDSWKRTVTVTTGPQQGIVLETHRTGTISTFSSFSVNASPGLLSLRDIDSNIILTRQTETGWDEIAFPIEATLPLLHDLFPTLFEL